MFHWLIDSVHRPTWTLGCVLCALGCATSQPASRPAPAVQPPQLTAAPGELRMHHPDEARSSATSTSQLGVLETVNATGPRAEARPPQPGAAHARAPRPIHVAPDCVPRAFATREGQLMLPSGLIIHGVPKSVSVRVVREQAGGDVWEITDTRGRRLALLRAESLGRIQLPAGQHLDQLASARSVGQRGDWGAKRVEVVSERILGESHVYTIERRTTGTAWIASGLDLSGDDARRRRSE